MADGGEKLPLSVAELSGLYILPGQSTLLHGLARFAVESQCQKESLRGPASDPTPVKHGRSLVPSVLLHPDQLGTRLETPFEVKRHFSYVKALGCCSIIRSTAWGKAVTEVVTYTARG